MTKLPDDKIYPKSTFFARAVSTRGKIRAVTGLLWLPLLILFYFLSKHFFFILFPGLPLLAWNNFGNLIIVFIAVIFIIQLVYLYMSFSVKDTQITVENKKASSGKSLTAKDPNEKIIGHIAGLARNSNRGYSVSGYGKFNKTENALIVTNKRLLFIAVPLLGRGKIVDDVNISMWQFFLMKDEIEKKLKEILSQHSLNEILQLDDNNYQIKFDDIVDVKITTILKTFVVQTTDGKNFSYGFRSTKDFQVIKDLLPQYFKKQNGEMKT